MDTKFLEPLIISPMGDSKTVGGLYQGFLETDLEAVGGGDQWNIVEFRHMVAGSGWNSTSLKNAIDSNLATAVYIPRFVLIDIGINDTPGVVQATFESNLAYVLDAVHTKWPLAQVLVMKVWGRGHDAECDLIDDTYIPNVLASRSAWASSPAGLDERIFLEGGDNGVTATTDGIHPNISVGYPAMSLAWKAAMGY